MTALSLKSRLSQHLTQIVRDRNPFYASQGHFYVKEYLRQELSLLGTVESQHFEIKSQQYENLILNLPGKLEQNQRPPILIGAHYDTVPGSPGADDNGTGLAVLLELAKYFHQELAEFPLRFVAFDLEEYGLLGSQSYAQFLKQTRQPLRLMLSLEMLGYATNEPNSQQYPPGLKYFYPSIGNFIALISNLKTTGDARKMSRQIRQANIPCEWLTVPFNGWMVWDTRRSDHSPFWDVGYRAMMVTDTANLRNPYYHRPSDKIETLNLDFLAGVCNGLIQAIKCL